MDTKSLFSFFALCGQLKHLKRTGWVNHSVSNPETVSGHMYRMAMMAFLFGAESKQPVSQVRCIKMSLVHDLAESIVGDLTPSCGVSKEEKARREKEAMGTVIKFLPKQVGDEIMQLWQEYEDHTSPEALVVHDLDKFDMIYQAYEYERAQDRPGELQQFFDSTKEIFKTAEVQDWARTLETQRQETLASSSSKS